MFYSYDDEEYQRLLEEEEERQRQLEEEDYWRRMEEEEYKKRQEEEEKLRQQKNEQEFMDSMFNEEHPLYSENAPNKKCVKHRYSGTSYHYQPQDNSSSESSGVTGCLIPLIVLIALYFFGSPSSCDKETSNPHNGINNSVPSAVVDRDTTSVVFPTDTASVVKEITTSILPSNSKNPEAEYAKLRKQRDYDKGYDAGYEDGCEDAESGEHRSYDNMRRNPSKAYELGYMEGYDEGYDDNFERREFSDYDDATLDDMEDEY